MDADKSYKNGINAIVRMAENQELAEAQKVFAVSGGTMVLVACFPEKKENIPMDILNTYNTI